jgi:hypothetical protein
MFSKPSVIESKGICPICERESVFRSKQAWLRDFFFCSGCGSIPRERALMDVIKTYYPNYRELTIHESSPGGRGASVKLHRECPGYSASHYYPDVIPGETHKKYGYQCQDLENLTLEDSSLDLLISQDVLEHIYNPDKAFQEIARVLKPGGAHIFSVPIINKEKPTVRWATMNADGSPNFLFEPEYHGNPIDKKGAPVSMHWGYDIAEYIMLVAGTPTTIVTIDDINKGIRAEYIEILVSRKPIGKSLLEL